VNQPSLNFSATLTNGIGDTQANRAWQAKSVAIASGAQAVIDLANFAGQNIGAGLGKDALGQDINLKEIVGIVIVNENAVTADGVLEVLPNNSRGWTPIGTHTAANGGGLYGQGVLSKYQPSEVGFPVSDASRRITLRASGGAVSYSMYVLGRDDTDQSSSSSESSISASSQSSSSQSTSSSSQSTSSSSESSSSVSSLTVI